MTLPASARRLLPLLVFAAGSHARAWGAGHQIVAAIACCASTPPPAPR